MAKHYGKDALVVGQVYVMRDQRPRAHRFGGPIMCKVRSVEVSTDGCVRVGGAYHRPDAAVWSEVVDKDGYPFEPHMFTFPHLLRLP